MSAPHAENKGVADMRQWRIGMRARSVAALAFLFAYLLSFLFEGRTLYALLSTGGVEPSAYILTAIVAHFLGQCTCGFFCQSPKGAKRAALLGMGVCLPATAPFFFAPSPL